MSSLQDWKDARAAATLRRVTLDDFLTSLILGERIAWLHSDDGPRGYLSHDDFAKILGTKRQVVINWEKKGVEPKKFAQALADFSGFPRQAFSRREAEELVRDSFGRRLQQLSDETAAQWVTIEEILKGMKQAGIQIPSTPTEPRSAATAPPSNRRKK